MDRRELDETESNICSKRIGQIVEAKRRALVKMREYNFMLNEGGLYNNYLNSKDELEKKRRRICSEVEELEIHLITLRDQLNNGVLQKGENKDGSSDSSSE